MKRPAARFASKLALAAVLVSGVAGVAIARERQTTAQGITACSNWCWSHNSTNKKIQQCWNACDAYWLCNGSDATATSCARAPATH